MSDITKKILLGLGFGAAVVTPLAITYYYLSRDDYQLQELQNFRRKQSSKEESKIFVTIRSDAVGAVIGRGGEVVRRIQDETNTRIDFKEDKGKKGDKIATITGSPDAVLDAEACIHRIISMQPITYQETFYVPVELVGRVIGKDGEVVRSLSAETGTRINVSRDFPNSAPGNPITIKGSLEGIKLAKRKIEDIVGDTGRKSRNSFNKSRSNSFRIQRKSFSLKPNARNGEPETEELVPTQDGWLQIYVATAKSPSKFWVQIYGTKSTELDKLTEAMTDFYEVKRNFNEHQLTDLKVGDIIASPFNMDESWYRVRVVGVEENQVRVYYLDFGDECVQSKESICSLKSEFLSALPFQAVECSLAGVVPVDGNEWTEEANKVFCDLIHAGNWIEIKACPIDKVGSSISIDLLDFKDVAWPINVADELVSKGLATRISPE